MTDKDKQCDYLLFTLLVMVCLLILAMAVSGCTSVKYVPVETTRVDSVTIVKTDTVFASSKVISDRESVRKDSIRESVTEKTTIVVNQQGDTLRTDRVKEITKDKYLKEQNEKLLATIDSLREASQSAEAKVNIVYQDKPYPVEKPLTRWQKIKMDFGGLAIGGLIVALLALVLWIVKRYKK